jgi:uncharacterized protein (TIGR02266 family)
MEGKRVSTVLMARFAACGKLAEGKIRNLSLGGLFVGTSSIPPEGESVRVRFRLPNGGAEVDVAGMVWWTTRSSGGRHRVPGFGLRLIDADPTYEEGVRDLIRSQATRF